jgi:hypothetical protein
LSSSITNVLVQNNLFDHTTIPPPGRKRTYQTSNAGYNAYVTNCNTLSTVYATDVILSNSLAYQTSWFGNYYQPANSPLISMGSADANLLGLYYYTTQTNQSIEGYSPVDIGYHYVSTDPNGNPLNSDADDIPNYLEDTNPTNPSAGVLTITIYSPTNGAVLH